MKRENTSGSRNSIEYLIEGVKGIQNELKKQQNLGLLPKDKEKTKVLLHIDKSAKWEPISQLIFGVRQSGFEIHPVYDFDEEMPSCRRDDR